MVTYSTLTQSVCYVSVKKIMAVVAVFILSYARKFSSITTVVIRQLALRNSVTYLLPISAKAR